MTDQIQADKDYFFVNKQNLEAIKEHNPLAADHQMFTKQRLYDDFPYFIIGLVGIFSMFLFLISLASSTINFFGFSIFLLVVTGFSLLTKYGLKLRIQSYANKMNQISKDYQVIEAKITKYKFFFGARSFSTIHWGPQIDTRSRNKKLDEAVAWYEFVSPKTGNKLKGKCVYTYSYGRSFERFESEVESMPALVAFQNDQVYELI